MLVTYLLFDVVCLSVQLEALRRERAETAKTTESQSVELSKLAEANATLGHQLAGMEETLSDLRER